MVLLVYIASKNIHNSLSVWCLKAAAADRDTLVYESDINQDFNEILYDIYSYKADAIAFSAYIWNINLVKKLAIELKKLSPDIIIAAGGPEVSFLNEVPLEFDSLIKGGELSFIDFLNDVESKNLKKIYYKTNLDINALPSPYTEEYFMSFKNNKINDIKNRLIYYESSRGCPFCCSYCLSSADKKVEALSLNRVKKEISMLVEKGAKCIKFVDRTFNANKDRALEILEFIYNLETDCTFHFEVAGDLFNEQLLNIIEKFPKCKIQFEIGIQTITEEALNFANRKTNINKLKENIKKLISFNNSHIHIDLIAGLPKDSFNGILKSIDYCLELKPNMLQLGFLKLLKGSILESQKYESKFLNEPPYEILCSENFTFEELQLLKKLEKLIDKFYNSGAYANSFNYALKLFDRPSSMLLELNKFIHNINIKSLSQKETYLLLKNFLEIYGDKNLALHFIKLDALSFNPKGKNFGFAFNRELDIEKEYINKNGSKNVYAEYFEIDNKIRIFDYENKDSLTKSFLVN